MKIAMIQFDATLLDVEENKKKVIEYIDTALEQNADMVLFPEFFLTGFALDTNIFQTVLKCNNIRDWFEELSLRKNVILGGSWLEYDTKNQNAYNTYGLFFPSGESFFHRKDIPTALENFCYTNGDETMVFDTPVGKIGIAMCWELLRTNTLRRMISQVDFVIAGSCWWGFTVEDGDAYYLKQANSTLAKAAPANFAKHVGKPLFHSSITGAFKGGSLDDINIDCYREIESRACAFDGNGATLCNCIDGPGIVYAEYQKNSQTSTSQNPAFENDSYWLMCMPKPLVDGFHFLNHQYSSFYENEGKLIYQKILKEIDKDAV